MIISVCYRTTKSVPSPPRVSCLRQRSKDGNGGKRFLMTCDMLQTKHPYTSPSGPYNHAALQAQAYDPTRGTETQLGHSSTTLILQDIFRKQAMAVERQGIPGNTYTPARQRASERAIRMPSSPAQLQPAPGTTDTWRGHP